MINKAKIRDINCYAFPNRKAFLDYIQDKKAILIAINAEKILNTDSHLHEIINQNIGYSDGVGAVMALKKKGLEAIKIPGAEFWLDIVKRFSVQGRRFYLLGSSQEVIESTVVKLKHEFTGIDIIGFRNGYLNDSEKDGLIRDLIEKKPDIIFVAQGSPRQEYLMDELIKAHPALYMGLGGSFDIYCGVKKRAPKIFINLHVEWLYRLLKEPTRFARQLVLVKFLVLLKMGRL